MRLLSKLVLTALVAGAAVVPAAVLRQEAGPSLVLRDVPPHPRLFFAPGEFKTFVEETRDVRREPFDRLRGFIESRGANTWNERDLQVQSQVLVGRVLLERGDRKGDEYLSLARRSVRYYLDRHTFSQFRDSHALVTGGSRWLQTVALAYDWGYDRWTPAERDEMAAWLRREIEAWVSGDHITRASPSPFRNDAARAVAGLVAAALAIYDDPGSRASAQRALDYAMPFYEEILRAHEYAGAGGGLAEGTFYGSLTAWSQVSVAEMLYTAAGVSDAFRRSPFFEARLRYVVHAAWPGYITNQFGYNTHQLAPVFGDARRGPTGGMLFHRATVLLLGKRLAGTDAAREAYAVVDRKEIGRTYTREWSLFDLLLWSPRVKPRMPTALAYRERTLGQVFARSSWDDRATWLSFNAGPHLDTHQHYDAGNLTIYRDGVDLLVDSGSFDTFGSRHWYNYYVRTVAHNTILIHDPTERWEGIWGGAPDNMVVNDGGQRTQAPLTPAPTLRQYLDNRVAYDHASIERYAAPDWGLYLKANLTNAYQNPRYQSARPDRVRNRVKAEYVGREVVYLRGGDRRRDAVVVFDRVVAANPSFGKAVLWHARQPFSTQASGSRVDEGEQVYTSSSPIEFRTTEVFRQGEREGRSRLFVTVLPVDPVRVRQIGDRPSTGDRVDHVTFNSKHHHRHVKDYFVEDPRVRNPDAHTGTPGRPEWPPFVPPEITWLWNDDLMGGWGRTRLQVEPARPEKADRFLTLLVPTSADDNASPRAEILRSPDGQAAGVAWSDQGRQLAVVFGTENSGGDLRTATVALPSGSGELLLVGLTPNTGYRVTSSGGAPRRVTISPDGGLASGPAGVLRLDLTTLAPLPESDEAPGERDEEPDRGPNDRRRLPQPDPGGFAGAPSGSIIATGAQADARWRPWIEKGLKDGRLKVRRQVRDPLVQGRIIERLSVLQDGLPIAGQEIVVQREGPAVVSLLGVVAPVAGRVSTRRIGPEEARRAIERLAAVELPRTRDPALVALRTKAGAAIAAYCERLLTREGPRTLCVDAATGERALVRDETRAQAESRTRAVAAVYRVEDEASAIGFANGVVPLSRRELGPNAPGTTTSAVHTHLQHLIAAWRGRYAVGDLIGPGRPVLAIVTARALLPDGAPAAYAGRGVILHADGSVDAGDTGRSTVAHELAHALVDRSSGLLVEGDSGTIEEEFAALMGELAVNRQGDASGELGRLFWSAAAAVPDDRLRLERAFVRAICRLLPSAATFDQARAAIVTAYQDLGGEPERLTRLWNR